MVPRKSSCSRVLPRQYTRARRGKFCVSLRHSLGMGARGVAAIAAWRLGNSIGYRRERGRVLSCDSLCPSIIAAWRGALLRCLVAKCARLRASSKCEGTRSADGTLQSQVKERGEHRLLLGRQSPSQESNGYCSPFTWPRIRSTTAPRHALSLLRVAPSRSPMRHRR